MRKIQWGLGVVIVGLFGCERSAPKPESAAPRPPTVGLPVDPADWVCPGTLDRVKPEQIQSYCAAHPDRGKPVRLLDGPRPLSQLAAKNAYDLAFSDSFLDKDAYQALGWWHDQTWRLTGPCVGAVAGQCSAGESYGIHPAVRVWYSPEVSEWMCNGRKGAIPDGAMIVKEMLDIGKAGLQVDAAGCMTVAPTVPATSWTLAIKAREASFDGWYWAGVARDSAGDPPIVDRSAFVDPEEVSPPPSAPSPAWFPTGDLFGAKVGDVENVPSVVYPYNMFGNYCVNCHASAAAESTFSDLANVLSPGIQYRWFARPPAAPPKEEEDDPHLRRPKHPKHSRAPAIQRVAATTAAPAADPAAYRSPFPAPLAAASPAFLRFFNQLELEHREEGVPFAEAWELRMPAETYDHVVSTAKGPPEFLTSDQCIGCHDATFSNASTPNMLLDVPDPKGGGSRKVNLSPYAEWRGSPMGLAGRDPIFFSQLQSETNHLPDKVACIENTCLHCHGVMGQRQYALDTGGSSDECKDLFGVKPPLEVPFGKPFRRDMLAQWPESTRREEQKYGALARDGVSCDVCHHVSPAALGKEESFTGNFVTGDPKKVYGPYDKVITKPMAHALGVEPELGAQIKSSELCGSCHNILLPRITNEGKVKGFSYEQSTHLEWQNSVYGRPGPEARSCQDCHMPRTFSDGKPSAGDKPLHFKIANIESSTEPPTGERLPDAEIALTERADFSRHSLHGLNVFLNQMFEQFPLMLGVRQIDYMTGKGVTPPLITGRDSMLRMAAFETAEVRVAPVEKTPGGELRVVVTVVNKTGHYLPSGVGFRRLFVEVLAEDARGKPLWASGRTSEVGAILKGLTAEPLAGELPLKNRKAYEPHHTRITREDQAQIYEEVVLDSAHEVTTSFLRRMDTVKDNRLRPRGFDPAVFAASPSAAIRELARLEGVKDDPHYASAAQTGEDQVEYVIRLDPKVMAEVTRVAVTLYSQSIPPGYLEQRFGDASVGPAKQDDIRRLFYLTSRLDTGAESGGKAFLQGWKLAVAHAHASVAR